MEFLTFQFYDKLSDFTLNLSIIILYLYLIINKRSRILDFTIALIGAVAVAKVIKYITNFPRPEGVLVFDDSSFPSMHTTIAFVVFFFFLTVCHRLTIEKGFSFKDFRKAQDMAMFLSLGILSFSTGILRYASTAHHLIDVIAGIILGLLISLVFAYYDFSARRAK